MNAILNKIFRLVAILMGSLMGGVFILILSGLPLFQATAAGFRLIYDPLLGWDSAPPMSPLDKNGEATPVVYFLGDSFTDGKRWPQLSQDYAAKKGVQFAGYSLGVSGYGTVQEYLKLKEQFETKTPSLVVLQFYAFNDVRDNFNKPPIYYGYGGVHRPYIFKKGDEYEIIPLSWFYRSYMKLTQASFCPSFDRWNKKHLKSFRDPVSWGPFYRTTQQEDPYVQGAWDATHGALTLIKKFLDEKGVPLLVLGIDNPFVVDADVYANHVEPLKMNDFSPGLPLQRLEGLLKDLGIRYVACTPYLQLRTDKLQKKMYEGPRGNLAGHFQLEGEDVLGQIAAEEIKKFLKPTRKEK